MRSTDIGIRIGEIYALPLFELASESKCVETVEQDLAGFMEVLHGPIRGASVWGCLPECREGRRRHRQSRS